MTRCMTDCARPLSSKHVSVACPGREKNGGPMSAIHDRGNLALLICDELLAELPDHTLHETWQSASAMTMKDLAKYARRAADRLARDFESGLASADLGEIVENAAVLFVLGLRSNGVLSPQHIEPCRVIAGGHKSPKLVAMV